MINIELPPLRARASDIPLLAHSFLEQVREDARRTVSGFSPEAMVALERYSWPGNVRELQNVVERAVLLGKEPMIMLADLPAEIRGAMNVVVSSPGGKQIAQGSARRPGAADHPERARVERLEPQHDGRPARHQPHDALQEDEAAGPRGRAPAVDLNESASTFRDGTGR